MSIEKGIVLAMRLGREAMRRAPEAEALLLPGGTWRSLVVVPLLDGKRKAICLDIERQLARDVDMIPLIALTGYYVGQPYVHGWADHMANNTDCADWSAVWFDQSQSAKGRS